MNAANPPGVQVVPLKVHADGEQVRQARMPRGALHHHRLGQVPPVRTRAGGRPRTREAAPGKQWEPEKLKKLLGNEEVYRRIVAGDDVPTS